MIFSRLVLIGLSFTLASLVFNSVSADDVLVDKVLDDNLSTEVILVENESISLSKPPSSIQKWYKPVNKRQVWLHTMFRLRRELLAIGDYSQQQQTKQSQELTQKWFNSFKKDYLEVGKMVPQWQEFLDVDLLMQLEVAVNNQKYPPIPNIIKKLEQSCEYCHTDYQAITRLMYRSADFNTVKVPSNDNNHKLSYSRHMQDLSNTVNRLKIALHDGFYSQAIDYIQPLQSQLSSLSASCADCHNYPPEEQPKEQVDYIFGPSQDILQNLKQALEQKQNKKARMSLGHFAVKVCARCHSVHRTVADLKEIFE